MKPKDPEWEGMAALMECTDAVKQLTAQIATFRAALDQAFSQEPNDLPQPKVKSRSASTRVWPQWDAQSKSRG